MNKKTKQEKSVMEYVESLISKSLAVEQRSTEEALTLSLEALSLSEEHNLLRQVAKSHVRIGRCQWIKGNFEEAINHLGEAVKLSDEIQETYSKVEGLIGLGNVYVTIEITDQAVYYYTSALNIAKDHGFGDLIFKCVNNLGTIYEDLKEYDIALEYYQKTLRQTIEIKDDYGIAVANINLANVNLSMGNIEESIQFIKSAIDYCIYEEKILLLAHAYHSIGMIYQKKEEYDQSINYLLLGVQKATTIKDSYILLRILIELGNSYDLADQFVNAQKYYHKALDKAIEVNVVELIPRVYEQMALFYEKHHKEKETVQYYKAFHQSSKDVEENRRKEKIKSIDYQSRLSVSLEETKRYRQLSSELRKSYESMHVLSKIGQQMTSTHKLDDILEQLYTNVNLLMNAEGLYVGLFDEEANALRFDWYIEAGEKLGSFNLSLDNKKSWMVWSFLNKQTIKINDIEKEYKNYIEGLAATRGELMHSAMYSPLMVEGEVIGVFSIQAREKNAYTDAHKDLLQTLGAYLAIAIRNAAKTKELAKLNKMLKIKSEHDGLTGIPNRRLFDEKYEHLCIKAVEQQSTLSVLIIDIDNFKEFNDQFGHLVGDQVVVSVAENLAKQKRNEHDFVARYGGDEFVAVLPNTSKEEAIAFADSFSKSLESINKTLQIERKVTVSIGIACSILQAQDSRKVLLYTADNQLYFSKANGKNQISAIHF